VEKFESVDEPLIYLITKGETTAENFHIKKPQILKLVKTAVQAKISLIQIREKQIGARLIYELASKAAKLTRNTKTKLLVNERADIALAANADGVHLTSRSLSADIIRKNFPKNFIIGVSAHTTENGENARMQGADFATFSPIFQSPGKGKAQGIKKLREVCKSLKPFPVLALGGIDETNYAEVLQAGAGGFAAVRFLNDEENLIKTAANLREWRRQTSNE
jgi:thiamine-phosphate pyrophosphorylase